MSSPTPDAPVRSDADPPATDAYDQLMDHAYDGIREYDNPLPSWWTNLWLASVIFSVAYVSWYHIGVGASIEEKYETAVARHVEKQLAGLGEIAADDATILRLMNDERMMNAMGGVFRGSCAQCHASDGGGNIGPNLTDDRYKNVKRPEDLYTVIADGIAGTSMPAWGQRLREPQMILLAAYVANLRGTTPAAPAAPIEGEVPIDPWSAFAPADDETADVDEATTG